MIKEAKVCWTPGTVLGRGNRKMEEARLMDRPEVPRFSKK